MEYLDMSHYSEAKQLVLGPAGSDLANKRHQGIAIDKQRGRKAIHYKAYQAWAF